MRDRIAMLIVPAVLGALSAPSSTAAEASRPEALVEGFISAWNTHDMKALAALFTEDADFVNVAGMWWKGRAMIQTMHERTHATRFKDTALVETNTTVRTVSPDVAVLHVRWELSGELDQDGKRAMTRHGIMQIVAVKQADGWRILAAQNTNAMPPV